MKNLITKHRSLVFYLLGLMALAAIFYFVGRKDERIKIQTVEIPVLYSKIDSTKTEIKKQEKTADKLSVKVDVLKKEETKIVYDTVKCKEIVSNLKEQIILQDTIIQKKDSIIYLTNTVVDYQDKIIKIKPKPKRFGIGIQTGYGFTADKITPYVGVGVSLNLFRF
ncbi:Uncharacterised protein [Algoriella xinjiangensis]|uniref:DUF6808 domain-containing protein n=1 Tax=Algoriella xinjiangensis TaxID=684065 RepID=UPI000F641121|nr:hypothetical protein [Algoriella xinjiangensis]VDH16857.1 Uncharacterised protein [Algoriella xinjiangensis]